MNTANLQLQGLLLAVASINNALVHKGLLSIDEVDLLSDPLPSDGKQQQGRSGHSWFSELTRMVGQTKEPYNDQM